MQHSLEVRKLMCSGTSETVSRGDPPEPCLTSLFQVDRGGKGQAMAARGSSLCKGTEVCGEREHSGSHIKFRGSAGN